MEQLTWLFFGVLALMVSGAALGGGFPRTVAQICTGFSVFLWSFWAISATNVYRLTEAGTRVDMPVDGALFLGLAAAAIMLLFLVDSIFGLFAIGDTGGYKDAT